MARPSKSVVLINKHLTKEEIQKRQENEKRIRGGCESLKPPSYLTRVQKQIFKNIIKYLADSDVLGNADIYILTVCSIAINRIQEIEKRINENPEEMFDRNVMNTKDKYMRDFYRSCNELSLSPQSRAKLANISVVKNEDDPLLRILKNG